MRARSVLVAAALVCSVVASPVRAATHDVTLEPESVVAGGVLIVRAEGFAPEALVDVFVDRVDRVLLRTDDTGRARARVTIPIDATPGTHWITVSARWTEEAAQAPFTVTAVGPDWPQVGNDPGRTGSADDERFLTVATAADLHELWYRDLEILEPGEEIFVTDSAGEIAEPAAAVDGAIVATWFGDLLTPDGRENWRMSIAALDLETGAVRWQRVAEPAGRWASTRPVVVGDVVVARWWRGTGLLGLDLATGAERWRRTVDPTARFGEPLVIGDRVLVSIDREGDATDGLLVLDGATGEGAVRPLAAGNEWRLVADGSSAAAVGFDSASGSVVVGLDPDDGATRWTVTGSLGWGHVVATDGALVASTTDGAVVAIELADGAERWSWRTWPDRDPVWTGVQAAASGAVFVTTRVTDCAEGEDCEWGPYRVRTAALDVATGAEVWVTEERDPPSGGGIAATPELLVTGTRLVDVSDGSAIRAMDPPVRPGTYGAQQSWADQPIVTGGRVIWGAADGTITVFTVATDAPRPPLAALVPDPSLRPPVEPYSPGPSSVPTPAEAGQGFPWSMVAGAALVLVAALIIGIGLRAWSARHPGGRHLPHPGSA